MLPAPIIRIEGSGVQISSGPPSIPKAPTDESVGAFGVPFVTTGYSAPRPGDAALAQEIDEAFSLTASGTALVQRKYVRPRTWGSGPDARKPPSFPKRASVNGCPAASYSPTGSPRQYHQRWRA